MYSIRLAAQHISEYCVVYLGQWPQTRERGGKIFPITRRLKLKLQPHATIHPTLANSLCFLQMKFGYVEKRMDVLIAINSRIFDSNFITFVTILHYLKCNTHCASIVLFQVMCIVQIPQTW